MDIKKETGRQNIEDGIPYRALAEAVRNTVANKKEIKTLFIREETLKHVKEPVCIYEVIIDDAATAQGSIKSAYKDPMKVMPEKVLLY